MSGQMKIFQDCKEDLFQEIIKSQPRKSLAGLWVVMSASFGSRWTNAFGKSAISVWGHYLEEFSDKAIVLAVESLVLSEREFPPSLPQFVAMCREARGKIRKKEERLAAKVVTDEKVVPLTAEAIKCRDEIKKFVETHRVETA